MKVVLVKQNDKTFDSFKEQYLIPETLTEGCGCLILIALLWEDMDTIRVEFMGINTFAKFLFNVALSKLEEH